MIMMWMTLVLMETPLSLPVAGAVAALTDALAALTVLVLISALVFGALFLT